MDTLLNPDPGLYIWTIISFLIFVGLLKAFAWGPLMKGVEAREERLRQERELAEAARKDAERLRAEIAAQMQGLEEQGRKLMSEAAREGEDLRAKLRSTGESEARALIAKGRAQLEHEKEKLSGELRREVGALSAQAVERLIRKSVDEGVRKRVLDDLFVEVDKMGKE
ncbi:MAG: F0F1 ATP synthase subunit B [Elusimicrobiota bacterium]